jgi:hypothetical protein
MGYLRYARPSDIITSLATITASGTVNSDPNYGLSALYDLNPAKPLKFDTAGPIRIVYDMGSARRMDAFSLPNSNLAAATNCVVALNATDSWAAPTVQTSLVTGADHLDGHRASPWADFTTVSGYSASGFRYCSLFVPAQSTNIKIGETPIIGNLRQFDHEPRWGGTKGALRKYLNALETETGVVRVNRRRLKQRTYTFDIKGGTPDYEALQALCDDAGGLALPWFFCPDDAVKTDLGLYVRFTPESAARLLAQEEFFYLPTSANRGIVTNMTVDVVEVSRSLPL